MPPFVSTYCTNSKCKHRNRYDLAELRGNSGIAYKGTILHSVQDDEEFLVTCEKCGQEFKFTVKRGSHASEE